MHEKSCGVIPYRGRWFLVVKHKAGHIDFPKGHVEPGETEEETAMREALEEAGIAVEITPGFREKIEYCPKPGVCKNVVFFLGRVASQSKADSSEIESCTWAPYDKAMQMLTHSSARELLKKAVEFLKI